MNMVTPENEAEGEERINAVQHACDEGGSHCYPVIRQGTDPIREVAEATRRCPICRKKMQKALIGKEPEVLIDSCRKGHGLWFDGGELAQVIQQLLDAPGASGKVVSFLGETFSKSVEEPSTDPDGSG